MPRFDPVLHQQQVNRNNARCERLRTESKRARERISDLEELIAHAKRSLVRLEKDRPWDFINEVGYLEVLIGCID